MNLFVSLERAGDGFHVLREPPVWGPPPLGGYPRQLPRDRVYTACGYRVPGSRCPRYVLVDGQECPEIVPASIDDVCPVCLDWLPDRTMLKAEISALLNECLAKHLGMLRYGNCWRLWTQITGNT